MKSVQYVYRSLDYSKFNSNIDQFVVDNQIESNTDFLLITSISNKKTYVFEKQDDIWIKIKEFSSTVGKQQTPTAKGVFKVGVKYPAIGGERSSAKFAIHIWEDYYYHSILYDAKGYYVIDSRLGQALSMGCIRNSVEDAKWMYENLPQGTKIIIH